MEWALLASLLLHALLFVIAWRTLPSAKQPASVKHDKPIQLVLVPLPAPKTKEPEKTAPSVPAPRANHHPARKIATAAQTPSTAAPSPAPQPPGPSALAEEAQAPAPIVGTSPAAMSVIPLHDSPHTSIHGHVISNNAEDNAARALVAKQEETARVKGRVDGWNQDELATIKGDMDGDPYVDDLRQSLRKAAEHPPPFESHGKSVVGDALHTYFSNTDRFGKTGNPFGDGWSPPDDPSHLAHQSEGDSPSHRALDGKTFSQEMEQFVVGASQLSQLEEGADLKVGAIVQISQGPDAKLVDVQLLAPSGDRAFDAFVLSVAPRALDAMPAFAASTHPRGLRTDWLFTGKVTYRRHLRDLDNARDRVAAAAQLPLSLMGGLPFEETTGDVQVTDLTRPQYECQVKLLRIYE